MRVLFSSIFNTIYLQGFDGFIDMIRDVKAVVLQVVLEFFDIIWYLSMAACCILVVGLILSEVSGRSFGFHVGKAFLAVLSLFLLLSGVRELFGL